MTQGGIVDGKAMEPSCKQMVEWLINAYTNIPEQGQNTLMKSGYAWV
jgi:hypothetical protein